MTTAHFGQSVAARWILDPLLVYSQVVKRREKRSSDITRFAVERPGQGNSTLSEYSAGLEGMVGMSGIVQKLMCNRLRNDYG